MKSNTKIVLGVIAVIVIVVLAVLLVPRGDSMGINNYKATVHIHIVSEHIANTVDINLFANGNWIKSASLDALSSMEFQYDAWLSGASGEITISGTGQGGGLGDSADSSTIAVSDGGTYNVYLTL
jgi:hypothetical protein